MLRWLVALKRGLCAALWILLAFGCGRAQEVQPLALSGLAADALVDGDDLVLLGSKLPLGLAAELELRGTVHAPGQVERAVRVTLSGRTLSSELLRAAFPPDLLADWGRASFEGSLSVHAHDAEGARFATVMPAVAFDLEAEAPQASQRLRHAVENLLEPLGLELVNGENGLQVARVQSGGPAWRAGLREGDAIVVSNGVRVHGLGDLAPAPNATSLALHVRDARGALHALRLPLADAAPLANPRGLAWCLLACPALLLLLTFLPLPAPAETLRRALARARGRRELLVSAPWVIVFAWASVRFQARLDPFLVLLVHCGLLVAVRSWRVQGAPASSLQLLGLWLAAACSAAVSGSDKWLAIVHDQGTGPWAWNVFARPPLAAALCLCLRYASALHGAVRTGPLARALNGAAPALLCSLFGVLFLGGAGTLSSALPAVLWAASKAWLCLGLWSIVPEVSRSAWRREAGYLAATLLATLAWSWVAPRRAFELGLGSALCVFALFIGGVAFLQLRAADEAAAREAPKPAQKARRKREASAPISPASST